jgi:3'(2'), 5'-bisphosphate nucleotidase
MNTPDDTTLEALLGPCLELARSAGMAILAVARESLDVQDKADGSPLTRADRASHDCLTAGLAGLAPPLPVLSEEGDVEAFLDESPKTYWLIDPLDGTKEFVKGISEYTVNVALVRQARPVLGVVHAPALATSWYAVLGGGAYRQEGQAPPVPLQATSAPRPRSAVASRSHLSPETEAFLQRNDISETTSRGSSLKLCAVAEGAAHIYPRHGPTNIWDTGAGAAVALEAGCRIIDLNGRDLSYDPADGLLREGFIVHPEGMEFEL